MDTKQITCSNFKIKDLNKKKILFYDVYWVSKANRLNLTIWKFIIIEIIKYTHYMNYLY